MIELIVLDVDGCLTDGNIAYSDGGREIKSFNVKDGLAMKSWVRMGKKLAIITGRESVLTKRRAEELDVTYLYQGCSDKGATLRELVKNEGLSFTQVAVIGDDLNDYSMLQIAGRRYTPHDGSRCIDDVVDIRLKNSGGRGAVREMIEDVIRYSNLESEFNGLWKQAH